MKKMVLLGASVVATIGIFAAEQSTVSAASKTMYVKVSGGIDLNVREKMSSSSKLMGKLKTNTKVTVHSQKNGWSKITYKKKTAYVSNLYLTSTKPKALKPTEAPKATTYYVKTGSSIELNVRKTESSKSALLGKIKNGEKVSVLSTKNGWSKINYKSGTAYVYSIYLSKPKPVVENVVTYYVNTGSNVKLNVRATKSTKGKVLATLKNNTEVLVVSFEKDWSKIKYGNAYAYVSSDGIAKKKLTVSNAFSPVSSKSAFYAIPGFTTNLAVRASASTSAKKLGEIKQNTKLTVIEQNKDWSKIKFGKKTGYVHNLYVAKVISTDFKRNTNKVYTVYDVESNGTSKTFFQNDDKGITKWGNVDNGFTHSETAVSNSYAFFNYETGHGFSINGPVYIGATAGSLSKGYSKLTSVDSTVKVKAGTFKNVVVQKYYNSKNKNTKVVYYAPKAGVIKATEGSKTVFELTSLKNK